jgi:signal transduction histidine kinase
MLLLIVEDMTESREAERTRLEHERQRYFASALLRGQDQERRRITLELHDDVNQHLVAIKLQLDILVDDLGLPEHSRARVTTISDRAGAIIEKITRLAHHLHPALLQHVGLPRAIEALCDEFSAKYSIECKSSITDLTSGLHPDVVLTVFRITQEALTNIGRHSGAKRASVSLKGTPNDIRFTIRDFGRGFDSAGDRDHRGLGLISMRERIGLLGGRIRINSRPDKGVRIEAFVPLRSASALAIRTPG